MERLTEWRNGHAAVVNHTQNYIDKLAQYEDAEEQGRLIVLPCNVGDAVFVLKKDKTIKSYMVSGIIIEKDNTWIDVKEIGTPYGTGLLNSCQFGIDVFLSREEAEKVREN